MLQVWEIQDGTHDLSPTLLAFGYKQGAGLDSQGGLVVRCQVFGMAHTASSPSQTACGARVECACGKRVRSDGTSS